MSNDTVIWRKKSGGDLTAAEINQTACINAESADCTSNDSTQCQKLTHSNDNNRSPNESTRKSNNTITFNMEKDSNSLPSYESSSSSSINERFFKNATSNASSMFACTQLACTQMICNPLRQIVSQNRRRYLADGFNLDLTYITDRIIAMGYPANATEAIYRNSMANTVKFLEHYHPGHYKVFNLRGQYIYDTSKFHNRVISFEMTDHHPPRLELMAPFCREVHDYLCADPRNIVAVHCKAGKGRTGVMICAYLCYISFYHTPRQNMDYYSIIRTHNNKGVTIPSQRRYVYYFSHLREKALNYLPLRIELVGIYLERPPKLLGLGKLSKLSKGALRVCVANGDVDVFVSDELWLSNDQIEKEEELHRLYPSSTDEDSYNPNCVEQTTRNCVSRRCYGWTIPSTSRVFLEGDVRVSLVQNSHLKFLNVNQDSKKIGHIWFNTMFTCPGFSGGKYIHGDEIYPISDNEIVHRVSKTDKADEPVKRKTKKMEMLRYKRRRGVRSSSSETSKKKMSGISYSSAPLATFSDRSSRFRQAFSLKSICVKCGRRARRSLLTVLPSTKTDGQRTDSEPNCSELETKSLAKNDVKRLFGLSSTTVASSTVQPSNISRDPTDLVEHSRSLQLQRSRSASNSNSSNSFDLSPSSDSTTDSSVSSSYGPRETVVRPTIQSSAAEMALICRNCAKSRTASYQKYQASFSPLIQRLSKQDRACNSKLTLNDHFSANNDEEKDSGDKSLDGEIVVDEPPGLDAHCPVDSLRQIYPHVKQATDKKGVISNGVLNARNVKRATSTFELYRPRYGIVEMLRDACRRDITPKPRTKNGNFVPAGLTIPKAPAGRPNAESEPRCLIRNPNEHVSLYNVHEIDKAYKSKELDPEFKIFIVTKCLDESNETDVRMANSFIDATYNCQIEKDHKRKRKMEMKHKKVWNNQADTALEPVQPTGSQIGNVKSDLLNIVIQSNTDSTQHINFRDSTSTTDSVSSAISSASSTSCSSAASYESHPRSYNPRLHKYFFRQRMSSKSRHPNVHYHCPLRPTNRSICERYGCESIDTPQPIYTGMLSDSERIEDTQNTRHSSLRSENSVDGTNDTLTNIHSTGNESTGPKSGTMIANGDSNLLADELIPMKENGSLSSDDGKSQDSDSYYVKNNMLARVYMRLNTVEENLIFDEFDFGPGNLTTENNILA